MKVRNYYQVTVETSESLSNETVDVTAGNAGSAESRAKRIVRASYRGRARKTAKLKVVGVQDRGKIYIF